MPGGADLDVVIVSYRCRDLLGACLASLDDAAAGLAIVAFVVDNDSRDGTTELVRERFPHVRLLVSEGNAGFAAASNRAIRVGSAPYVLVLNPDTRLEPGSLGRLLDVVEGRPEVGIIGCRLVREDGSLDHAARRSFPTFLGALGHATGLGRRDGAPARLAQYRAPGVEAGVVDAINGAFMLVRRAALDEVGLFDEGYWMYFEDLDLCRRFRDAGWLTWYEPSVTAVHLKAGTSGRYRRPRLDWAFHYGIYRFWRTHYAPRRNPLVNAAAYAGIAAGLAVSLLRGFVGRSLRRA